MTFNPPIKLLGTYIYSLSGLVAYADHYYKELVNLKADIRTYVERRLNLERAHQQMDIKAQAKSQEYWKKKYFKLKHHHHVKYCVYEGMGGIKVLIPKTGAETNSPKVAVNALAADLSKLNTASKASYYRQEGIENEDGPNNTRVTNIYRGIDSLNHVKSR